MPTALVANLINLSDGEELMISKLEKRITLATRLKFEAENVFVKRLRFCKIMNLDRHVIAPIDLNAHIPPLCASYRQKGTRLSALEANPAQQGWVVATLVRSPVDG